MSVDRLSRLLPVDRPEALRSLEAEIEFLLGRVRCTGQRQVVLLVVSHRRSRPQPPTEVLRELARTIATELPAVKQGALTDAGLLFAAEATGSTDAASLRHRLSVIVARAAPPQAPWRGVVDVITVSPWRPAFESLAPFARRPLDTDDTEQSVSLAVLADGNAPRRLRDYTRTFVDGTQAGAVSADASLAVSEMATHLVLESNPESVRLDVRVGPSTVWLEVHARCVEPSNSIRPQAACCSSDLVRRLARRAGESRTLSRHRLWCEL